MNIVEKQKILNELEAKAQNRQLREFAKKIKEQEENKGKELEEPAIPSIVEYRSPEEVANEISEERRDRFKQDKHAIELLKDLRKPPPPKLAEKVEKDTVYKGIMYPVDPALLAVLYEGVSHNNEGRRLYLYLRNKSAPYDRYIYSQTNMMDIGWKIEERAFPPHKEFATEEIIKRTFYRSGGIKGETLRNRLPFTNLKPFPEQI